MYVCVFVQSNGWLAGSLPYVPSFGKYRTHMATCAPDLRAFVRVCVCSLARRAFACFAGPLAEQGYYDNSKCINHAQ